MKPTTKTQEKYENAFKELINSPKRTQLLRELQENMDFVLKALQEQAKELSETHARTLIKEIDKACTKGRQDVEKEHSLNKDLIKNKLQAQRDKFEEVLNNKLDECCIGMDFPIYRINLRKIFEEIKEALNNQIPQTNLENTEKDTLMEDKTPSSKPYRIMDSSNSLEDRGLNIKEVLK